MLVFVMCDMDHVMYTSRDHIYTPQDVPLSLSLSLLSLCGAAAEGTSAVIHLLIDKGSSAHR